MDTLEDAALHRAVELFGLLVAVHDVDVLGTEHHVNGLVLLEARVDASELLAHEAHQTILQHGALQYITLADKISHEAVLRLVVDVGGGANLLDDAIVHHHDGIAQGQRLFLVVGDVDEGDAQRLMHVLQFELHVLAHLQVEGGEGLVEEQHLGLVDDGAGNGHTLLLSTRQAVHVAFLIIRHAHHLQRFAHGGIHLLRGHAAQLQSEGDVVKHVQMGEQGIALEHRVHRALVRGRLGDVLTTEQDFSL